VTRLGTALALLAAACGGGGGGTDERRRFTWEDADDPAWCRGSEGSPTTDRGCGCTADCDRDELCLAEEESGWPGGDCIRSCADDCPDGTTCTSIGACAKLCETGNDCRPGYMCTSTGDEEPKRCFRFCQADSECVVFATCDRYTGNCGEWDDNPGQGAVGLPCNSGLDCLSGVCGTLAGVPGGFCTALCSTLRQGCPEEAHCVGQFGPGDEGGACFPRCESHDDCPSGFACGPAPDGSGVLVCGGAV